MQQIHTIRVTIEAIMRRPEFARGFQDVRSGRRPDFDALTTTMRGVMNVAGNLPSSHLRRCHCALDAS